jgi:hypothetical protein
MRWMLVMGMLLGLGGCAGVDRPFTYTDQKEMADRPGLFSGKTGAILLYRD